MFSITNVYGHLWHRRRLDIIAVYSRCRAKYQGRKSDPIHEAVPRGFLAHTTLARVVQRYRDILEPRSMTCIEARFLRLRATEGWSRHLKILLQKYMGLMYVRMGYSRMSPESISTPPIGVPESIDDLMKSTPIVICGKYCHLEVNQS